VVLFYFSSAFGPAPGHNKSPQSLLVRLRFFGKPFTPCDLAYRGIPKRSSCPKRLFFRCFLFFPSSRSLVPFFNTFRTKKNPLGKFRDWTPTTFSLRQARAFLLFVFIGLTTQSTITVLTGFNVRILSVVCDSDTTPPEHRTNQIFFLFFSTLRPGGIPFTVVRLVREATTNWRPPPVWFFPIGHTWWTGYSGGYWRRPKRDSGDALNVLSTAFDGQPAASRLLKLPNRSKTTNGASSTPFLSALSLVGCTLHRRTITK